MSWRRAALVAGMVLVAGTVAGGALFGTGTWTLPSQIPAKAAGDVAKGPGVPRWDAADAVLQGVVAGDGRSESSGAGASAVGNLATVLANLSDAPELGGHVGAAVVELGSGETVYETNIDDAFTPASTMKILTSVAVLDVLGPDHRFTTSVVGGAATASGEVEITLVGGGDPVLASTDDAAVTPGAAILERLASRTVAALDEAGTASVRLSFDDGLFSGPAVDPDWRPSYVPDGVAGPVQALSVDGARETPGLRWRVDDPSRYAAAMFAGMLEEGGIDLVGDAPERVSASADAPEIASVASPTLSAIVEYVLVSSDNDAAETLTRHVALGMDRPGSSDDAAAAVADALAGLGVGLDGVRIRDGSGLARNNEVTVAALVSALSLAAADDHPQLRPVLTGLPVSGFSGTLDDRVADGGSGYVRAKTGTLTGVHSLAGVVTAAEGPGYVFAILADDAADALGARAALDEFAAELATG